MKEKYTAFAVDVGNTAIKIACFSHTKLTKAISFDHSEKSEALSFLKKLPEGIPCIYASVASKDGWLKKNIQSRHTLTEADPKMKLPIRNRYKSKTLGVDRLANAVAIARLFCGFPALSIDIGTCIKFDMVNAAGEYLGGAISPGVNMRFKALNEFTAKLPLIESYAKAPELIGHSTEASILSGVINGVNAEIKGIISEYNLRYPLLRVALTGGDVNYLEKDLKNSIFAEPNLTLIGLYHLLLHQNR
jgi:type III pantothenate kinase